MALFLHPSRSHPGDETAGNINSTRTAPLLALSILCADSPSPRTSPGTGRHRALSVLGQTPEAAGEPHSPAALLQVQASFTVLQSGGKAPGALGHSSHTLAGSPSPAEPAWRYRAAGALAPALPHGSSAGGETRAGLVAAVCGVARMKRATVRLEMSAVAWIMAWGPGVSQLRRTGLRGSPSLLPYAACASGVTVMAFGCPRGTLWYGSVERTSACWAWWGLCFAACGVVVVMRSA